MKPLPALLKKRKFVTNAFAWQLALVSCVAPRRWRPSLRLKAAGPERLPLHPTPFSTHNPGTRPSDTSVSLPSLSIVGSALITYERYCRPRDSPSVRKPYPHIRNHLRRPNLLNPSPSECVTRLFCFAENHEFHNRKRLQIGHTHSACTRRARELPIVLQNPLEA